MSVWLTVQDNNYQTSLSMPEVLRLLARQQPVPIVPSASGVKDAYVFPRYVVFAYERA